MDRGNENAKKEAGAPEEDGAHDVGVAEEAAEEEGEEERAGTDQGHGYGETYGGRWFVPLFPELLVMVDVRGGKWREEVIDLPREVTRR